MLNIISQLFDNRNAIELNFLNFGKAAHRILCAKLTGTGQSPQVIDRAQSFLKNR